MALLESSRINSRCFPRSMCHELLMLSKQNTPSPSSHLWCFPQPSSFPVCFLPCTPVAHASFTGSSVLPLCVPCTSPQQLHSAPATPNPPCPCCLHRPPSLPLPPLCAAYSASTSRVPRRALAHPDVIPQIPCVCITTRVELSRGHCRSSMVPNLAAKDRVSLFPCRGVDSTTNRAFPPLPITCEFRKSRNLMSLQTCSFLSNMRNIGQLSP